MDSLEGAIPLSEPVIQGNEWKYVKECLDTNWVSSAGKYVDAFEQQLANYVGAKYAVACVNGTSALHIALILAGVNPDEEVILPAITFVAPANAVRYVGAWPVFVDVQPDIWQMDPQKLKNFLNQECTRTSSGLKNNKTKRFIKAILPVHILGHPVDMDPLRTLAEEFQLKIIEDATESLGAQYKHRSVGTLGDMACFSFNGNKIITTGGGGMLVTNNESWMKRARYLTTQAKDDPVESIHHEIGYNYRLTNIQAAMGLAQMECLDKFITAKRDIAGRYHQAFKNLQGVSLPVEAVWAKSTFWLYTILIDEEHCGVSSRELLQVLKQNNIEVRPLWHPVPGLKPFQNCYAYQVEAAHKIYGQALSLPSSANLKREQQEKVIRIIRETIKKKETLRCH